MTALNQSSRHVSSCFALARLKTQISLSSPQKSVSARPARLATLALALAMALPLTAFAAKPAISVQPGATERLVANENARMTTLRAGYLPMFAQAYARYPQIPAGVLEALAYTKTRWNPVQPSGKASGVESGHMAPVFGLMGLADGQAPFENQVLQAARLTGLSEAQIKADSASNILAAAALLGRDIDAAGLKTKLGAPAITEIGDVLRNALGLGAQSKSTIDTHVRDSFAYGVLSVLDQGVDDNGVRIKAREVAFEKVFSIQTLATQKARFVRLDLTQDRVETSAFAIDAISETLSAKTEAKIAVAKSTDYAPALYRQSPNESARSANPTHITIHQMEGFYDGSIATFLVPGGTSAHYLVRDSDGQVTQMVRESRKGAHVFLNNDYSIGIEQEGFRGQSGWYSNATYREVIAMTKNMCVRWAIPCTSVYRGAASDTENIQATSLRIKGHQHFPDQAGERTDPGRFFNWTRFADGIAGSAPVPAGVLDSFEAGEGRFADSPTASGSTVGISTASTAERNSARVKSGSWSEQIKLVDSTATSANYEVRFLSGGGNPAANAALQKAGGRLGFWAYTAAPGVSVQMAVDDSDGTERSISKAVPVNAWTFFEWKLDDQTQWDPWVGGNGTITAAQVTLDAIWFLRAQNAADVFIYIDDVQFKVQ
jgi:N-acetyl-anhydromuramyl-L-alanine amidase AmpD